MVVAPNLLVTLMRPRASRLTILPSVAVPTFALPPYTSAADAIAGTDGRAAGTDCRADGALMTFGTEGTEGVIASGTAGVNVGWTASGGANDASGPSASGAVSDEGTDGTAGLFIAAKAAGGVGVTGLAGMAGTEGGENVCVGAVGAAAIIMGDEKDGGCPKGVVMPGIVPPAGSAPRLMAARIS